MEILCEKLVKRIRFAYVSKRRLLCYPIRLRALRVRKRYINAPIEEFASRVSQIFGPAVSCLFFIEFDLINDDTYLKHSGTAEIRYLRFEAPLTFE